MKNKKQITYEFGVMSNKYQLKSKSLRTAKLAMVLFFRTKVPIAIYSPIIEAFESKTFMGEETQKKPPKDLKEVYNSIKEIKLK